MQFSPERAAHLRFNLFAIAAVAMLSGIPLAFCLIMVAATRLANFMTFGMSLNANNRRNLLAALKLAWTPQIIPDFTIRGKKYTESHSANLSASKPFL